MERGRSQHRWNRAHSASAASRLRQRPRRFPARSRSARARGLHGRGDAHGRLHHRRQLAGWKSPGHRDRDERPRRRPGPALQRLRDHDRAARLEHRGEHRSGRKARLRHLRRHSGRGRRSAGEHQHVPDREKKPAAAHRPHGGTRSEDDRRPGRPRLQMGRRRRRRGPIK